MDGNECYSGGAGGTRTPYLILAKDALSLMSYSPTIARPEEENLNPRTAHRLLAIDEEVSRCQLYVGRMTKRRGRVASTPTLTAGQ